MKRPLTTYAFNPGAGTLDLSGLSGFDVRRLFAVIHLPTGSLIYAPTTTHGYSAISNGVLTLKAQVGSYASSDPLLVIYDDAAGPLAENATLAAFQAADHADQVATNGNITSFAVANHADLSGILAKLMAKGSAAAPSADVGTVQGIAGGTPVPVTIATQRAETLWTDDTGAFYVRVDIGGAITWTDISGNAASAPTAANGARPAGGASVLLDRASYKATAAGTGYAIGDLLDHFVTTDPATGAVLANFWINIVSGAKIAAPTAASIVPYSPLPDGAPTSGQAAAGNVSLATLAANSPTLGQKSAAGSVPVVLASDQAPPSQRSSSGSLAAAAAAVALMTDGMQTAIVQLKGTWAGTVSFFGSFDGGATLYPLSMIPYGGGAALSAVVANGVLEVNCAGMTNVYAQMTAFTSGSCAVVMSASVGSRSAKVETPSGSPVGVTQAVGTPAEGSTVVGAYAALNLLSTVAASVTRVGLFFFQNQSANLLTLVLDDGAGGAVSVYPTPTPAVMGGPYNGIGSEQLGPHVGRIRVYGAAGSQHSLRVQ